MAKAKSSNLALIPGPSRYVEGSYREVPPTFVYHYTFKQIGNTVFVANAALPTQLKPKLTLSQLVAKFPNKTLDDLILENAKAKRGWTRATPEQAEQYRKIKAQHDTYCLKTFAKLAKARVAFNATTLKTLQSRVEQCRQASAVLEAKLKNISNLKIVSVTTVR
jgi:hypothetical protein